MQYVLPPDLYEDWKELMFATEVSKNILKEQMKENDMAEINIPKFKFRPPTQEMLFREIAEKEYKPVVEIISDGFRSQIEGDVFRIIHSYGINVDKGELIKALQYDRQQYEKGFIDGCRGAVADIKAEVAREIFEEIEKMMYKLLNDRLYIAADMSIELAELKKKYTEGKP